MAVVIRGKDLKGIDKEGKPGHIHYGIYDEKVENPKIVMGHTITPPGARRSRLHYHANCNVGQYVISGRRRESVGPDYDRKEYDLEAGDFIFIPQGEIHGSMNLSDTEPSEIIFVYTGVNNRHEAKTIYVEPPLK
jgi:uncharacterized RmlC-like cupin family protein